MITSNTLDARGEAGANIGAPVTLTIDGGGLGICLLIGFLALTARMIAAEVRR